MNYLSICSGIEAASVAWHPLGWKPFAFSEIEPFPSAVLAHHWPDVPNLGDMTKFDEWGNLHEVDLLVGGTPCFTAGHLVLTSEGYTPIEDVRVGDMVATHLGRMKKVLRVGSKKAQVGILKLLGRTEDVTCTPGHPFLAVDFRNQNTTRENRYARVEHCGNPEWVRASELVGKNWCSLTSFDVEIPLLETRTLRGDDLLEMAGWYLGDGWTRDFKGKKKKSVCLGLNPAKYDLFKSTFPELAHSATQMPTSVRVTINDTRLANWLVENFSKGAINKRIPAWVFAHPGRQRLLRGYTVTDGCEKGIGKYSASTVSVRLAHGIATLAETLGNTSSVKNIKVCPTTIIEGRTVKQNPCWQVTWSSLSNVTKARVRHGFLLRKVKSYSLSGEDIVYNIEVEDDNSYVLNGAVVHNCQAFSVAGLRKSLDDARGNLSLTYISILNKIDHERSIRQLPPAVCVWENVPGVLNTKDNAFGCFLGGLAGEELPLIPPGGKWSNAGYVRGPQRTVAWRILDAQYLGVAQRRRRVFVVASARDGFCPEQILFEFDSVRRDSPPSREARKEIATPAGTGFTSGSFGALTAKGPATMGAPEVDANHYLPSVRTIFATDGQANAAFAEELALTLNATNETPYITFGCDLSQKAEKNRFPAVLVPFHSNAQADQLPSAGDECFTSAPLTTSQNDAVAYGIDEEWNGTEDFFGTLKARMSGGGFEGSVAIPIQDGRGIEKGQNGLGIGSESDPAYTLDQTGAQAVCAIQGTVIGRSDLAGPQGSGADITGKMFTLTKTDVHAVAFAQNTRDEVREMAVVGALAAQPGMKQTSYVRQASSVRRLTPTECARLQGFSDDHCKIPWRGKPAEDCPDGPQYKAYGNSMAVPCMQWIGERIDKALFGDFVI